MRISINEQIFFALLRAGLFPVHGEGVLVHDSLFKDVDWGKVYQIAQEQSVLGIVLQGIEELRAKGIELSVPKVLLLQWIGEVQMIEQRNKDMNAFVADLIENLRREDIYAVLVKGQGIAQCYEKPLWRSSGDVDLLLSDTNYKKAQKFLVPLASKVGAEYSLFKHQGIILDSWEVEIHGCLHSGLSAKIERELDAVQYDTFYGGHVRSLMISNTQVFLLKEENDVFYVFTHILQHFYKGGIGLRQLCDWCRLLYTYKDSLNHTLLEKKIKRAGLITEWKTFAAFAVEYLGMPEEAMPYLDVRSKMDDCRCEIDKHLKRKADRILEFVMMSGNFGHKRDSSYYNKYPYLVRKCFSVGRRIGDIFRHAQLFPIDSLRFSFSIIRSGLYTVVRGE